MTSPLFPHQRAAIDMAMEKGNLAIFHEQGLGKTRTVLEIFKRHRETQPDLKLLVVCPISVIEDAWRSDVKEYTPEFTFGNLRKEKRPERFDIMAVNYEKLIAKSGMKIATDLLSQAAFMVAVDESSRMKTYNSKTTKTLLSLGNKFKYRYIMSGTPAPNGQIEYWGQINFISPGLLKDKFTEFRNRFFNLEKNLVSIIIEPLPGAKYTDIVNAFSEVYQKSYKYRMKSQEYANFTSLIKSVTHRMDKQTANLNLPPKIFQTRKVSLSTPERKEYDEMLQNLIIFFEGTVITAENVLSKGMKLRQIISGFVYDRLGRPLWIGKSKVTELQAVLSELGKRQVVIWCEFVEEIDYILTLYPGLCSTLYGKTKDKEGERAAFKAKRTQYLLVHPKSGAHGLNLQETCSTMIYFSNSHSFENYTQSQDRTHRSGQTADSCLYIHLVAENTIEDELIYPALAKKGKVSNDDLRKFLRR